MLPYCGGSPLALYQRTSKQAGARFINPPKRAKNFLQRSFTNNEKKNEQDAIRLWETRQATGVETIDYRCKRWDKHNNKII